jgi:ElaB/YqjD/DUF883 family membrane-anchored ribosome-binding protein
MGSVLSWPSFVDVASPDAKPQDTGLDQPVVATLETFDGFTYTVKVGRTNGTDNLHIQVALAASFPKERTPGKDEKKEDAEKLDKEFKEKLAKQEEKLKQEKAVEKWTYVVSKWTVENLIKERKDLFADKKDAAKDGAKDAALDSDPKLPGADAAGMMPDDSADKDEEPTEPDSDPKQ